MIHLFAAPLIVNGAGCTWILDKVGKERLLGLVTTSTRNRLEVWALRKALNSRGSGRCGMFIFSHRNNPIMLQYK